MNNLSSAAAISAMPPSGSTDETSGWRRALPASISPELLRRLMPVAGAIALVGVAWLLWSLLSAPMMRKLTNGQDDAANAAAVAVLDGASMPYEIDRNSGAITVSEDDFYRARMMLAAKGVAAGADQDSDGLDMPMGASRAVEGARLKLAREHDLARSIEAIAVVETARVHLAIEPPSAFLRDAQPPSASVMLHLKAGQQLASAQVAAITRLIVTAVPGLSPDQVSIVDSEGRLLSGDDGPGAEQLRMQDDIESRLRRAVSGLLVPMVGDANFSAEVSAELEFADRQSTRETYPENESRLSREEGGWTADRALGGNAGAGYGIPGALSNRIPPAATVTTQPPGAGAATPGNANALAQGTVAQGTAGPNDQRTSERFQRSFQLGREISITRAAVGTVRRLSVAVVVADTKGKARTAGELQAIESLVKAAVGYDAARGDVVTVTSRPFVAATPAVLPWWQATWAAQLARNGSAAVALLLMFWFVGRPLLRHLRPQTAAPVSSGDDATSPPLLAAPVPTYTEAADLLRGFVASNPTQAAQVMGQLLNERDARG